MAALTWLLIPLVAAIGAGAWGSWAARNRHTGDGPELAGYARFREAMERSHSGADPVAEPEPLPAEPLPAESSRQSSDGPAPAVH